MRANTAMAEHNETGDEGTAVGDRATRLRARYALTAQEARVALLIADGKMVKEVAKLLEVSVFTVRAHLRNIFCKTGVSRQAALVGLAALVSAYAVAIAINLLRGRHDIDCGCGGASHPLSWGLVARNMVLAAAAILASRPTVERSMEWTDALTLVMGVLAFYALYLMADELLRQASRLAQIKRSEQG